MQKIEHVENIARINAKTFECNNCNRKFKTQKSLNQHINATNHVNVEPQSQDQLYPSLKSYFDNNSDIAQKLQDEIDNLEKQKDDLSEKFIRYKSDVDILPCLFYAVIVLSFMVTADICEKITSMFSNILKQY
jgi:uncharacterized protein Yka (UPF0111/DUF47 family)